jgi:hypothetical protein
MTKEDKRIVIAFPCRDRAWVLPYFLKHIYNIDYNKKLIDIYCVVNNSKDLSHKILKEFKKKYESEYNSINIELRNNYEFAMRDERRESIRLKMYHWLADLRNLLVNKCVELNCDYMLSVDTDILVPSDILKRLINHNKDYVSSLIYNGYLFKPRNVSVDYKPVLNAYKFPNILNKYNQNSYKHIVNYKVKNPNLLEKDTIAEVDFTGAVFLVSREVCKVARFGWDKQGEDEVFCRTAKENGFKLYCDLSLYSQHMMNKDILDLYLKGELTYSNGEIINIK